MKQIVVVGGGPAGLMAAGQAAQRGLSVTLLEGQPRPARKLLLTGKGRCNVTNAADLSGLIENVPRNPKFLYAAFSAFSAQDTMAFFEARGVPLKVERGNRVFPQSDRAADIADALIRFAKQAGVIFRQEKAAALCVSQGKISGVRLLSGAILPADGVILATGGRSYPATGSTGDGYRMAREVGHTITPQRPSLVPFEVREADCAKLQGLSLRNVGLRVAEAGREKPVWQAQGELLFTHFGLSGPLILRASADLSEIGQKDFVAAIDLKPALSPEQLDARLLREIASSPNRQYANLLASLLPAKLIPVFVARVGIPPDCRAHALTRAQRSETAGLLKLFAFHLTGYRPYAEAVVTRGGVAVGEVEPGTMRSKRVAGLSFAGELLDVDGYTGGFNLQIAFSTGYLAGNCIGNGEELS